MRIAVLRENPAVEPRVAATPETANLPPAEREYPGEEGRVNFLKRVSEAVWSIAQKHPGETVAVVSHGGPIALFCQAVLGLPYKRPMPFAIDNCSLGTVDCHLLGTIDNCCTPHTSLRLAAPVVGGRAVQRTPAMATGITDHCWTVQELLSFHVPPPRCTPPKQRGRPSRALQCLIARWCS